MVAIEEDKLSLKVLVHKGRNKVIFAEADGNFVNALFSIMALPLGTIVRVLEKCPDQNLKAIGSLNNLYQSLVELPADCFSAEEGKFMMLNPKTKLYDSCRNLKLNHRRHRAYKVLLTCWKSMTRELEYKDMDGIIGGYDNEGLFVPNAATFIVTDDLHVKPNTLDLSFGLLFSHGYTDASHVEERTIEIGHKQALVRGLHGNNRFALWVDVRLSTSRPHLRIGYTYGPFTKRLPGHPLWGREGTGTEPVPSATPPRIDIEWMLILVKAALLLKYPLTYLVFHDINPIRGSVNPRLGTSIQHLTGDTTAKKNSKTMTLKLSLQKLTSKFLFAEAKQDFVDFVFGFLEIPLGTLIGKLTNGDTSFECLDNLYASIANMKLGETNYASCLLTEPRLEWKYVSKNQIFPLYDSVAKKVYRISLLDDILMHYSHGIGEPKYIMRFKDPRIGGCFLTETTTYIYGDG
ncbi:hypothetical protein OSB04_015115 [Centaurea solstitialis]|uniref:Uncharacterized protein n=1 Tax=Centaurea solstitialis TaxID=347529 RepID=A0AA38SYD6_9ASTR|nr:hypothetical protein OSB04_015115 [Centaurea solstitialis]